MTECYDCDAKDHRIKILQYKIKAYDDLLAELDTPAEQPVSKKHIITPVGEFEIIDNVNIKSTDKQNMYKYTGVRLYNTTIDYVNKSTQLLGVGKFIATVGAFIL